MKKIKKKHPIYIFSHQDPDHLTILECGFNPTVYPTVGNKIYQLSIITNFKINIYIYFSYIDFGTDADPKKAFDLQRKFAPNGPLVRKIKNFK